ncbi:DUF645 family protein [Vibrio cholerae]|uniref:DUF645 family protein n=1 Tax=Vibrio cholerae TaxID=666 RepID=UPI0011F1E487|nr:DUF645 family protein [Vibrio cholerae]
MIAVILLSLSRTLNRGQLSLDRFRFWQPASQLHSFTASQLLALDVCLCDAFA